MLASGHEETSALHEKRSGSEWETIERFAEEAASHALPVSAALRLLKMADEQSKPPHNKTSSIPKGYDWPSLRAKDGDELETHYRHVLETLGKRTGMLGVIAMSCRPRGSAVRPPAIVMP